MTEKKRIGRPPKRPEDRRSTGILVKMTHAEHAAIHALANHLNQPAGEIMRSSALNKAKQLGIQTELPAPVDN